MLIHSLWDSGGKLDLHRLLELVQIGRQMLENGYQIFGFLRFAALSVSLTILLQSALPMSAPAYFPLPLLVLNVTTQIPLLCGGMTFHKSPENLLSKTPRKRFYVYKCDDQRRFATYVILRCTAVAVSSFIVAWLTTASVFGRLTGSTFGQR